MIVRWGLDELPGLLSELDISAPLLVSTPRWQGVERPLARPDPRWDVMAYPIRDAEAALKALL